jgi:hypothetical protein
MASVYLRNIGSQTIIGGAVQVAFTSSDGSSTDPLELRFDLLPSVGMEDTFKDKKAIRDPLVPIGALQPGLTYRIFQSPPPLAQGAVAVSATAQAVALVFIDNTAVGDSKAIDLLFESWRDIGATWAAWNHRAGELQGSGAGAAWLQQLSGQTKASLSKHPPTEARVRLKVPDTEEEALARHSLTLQEVDHFVDEIRVGIDAQRMSQAEGLSLLRNYLRLRAETTAAHAYRKGGE